MKKIKIILAILFILMMAVFGKLLLDSLMVSLGEIIKTDSSRHFSLAFFEIIFLTACSMLIAFALLFIKKGGQLTMPDIWSWVQLPIKWAIVIFFVLGLGGQFFEFDSGEGFVSLRTIAIFGSLAVSYVYIMSIYLTFYMFLPEKGGKFLIRRPGSNLVELRIKKAFLRMDFKWAQKEFSNGSNIDFILNDLNKRDAYFKYVISTKWNNGDYTIAKKCI